MASRVRVRSDGGRCAGDGLDISYQRVGARPPLVPVHGAGEDSRIWQPQLAALADEFTVVAWDEPGAGRSCDVPAGFGLADYAECLAELIEALALGRAHVAGLSWGGTVVQEFYRQRPDLVATLILIDTYAGWKGSLATEEVSMRVAAARQMLAASAAEFYHLLIWGELDVRSPLSVAQQFEQAIPDSTLVVIRDCGHVSNLEAPDQVNRTVRDFCCAHPPY